MGCSIYISGIHTSRISVSYKRTCKTGNYTLVASYNDHDLGGEFTFEKQIEITDTTKAFELLDSTPSSENITMLKDSKLVFSGKLITKSKISSSDGYNLEFEILENFKNVQENIATVYTHEGAWKGCAGLQENSEYLIFASPKNSETITCYHAINLPTDITNELREFSERIPWW